MKYKRLLIEIIILTILCVFVYNGLIKACSTKIPVIMYHHFDDISNEGAVVTKENFRKQIKYLKDNGYNTITIKDLIDAKQNKVELPDKPILITSDDGYLSNYEFMYPILKENKMKATIHVIGENIDNAQENIENGKGIPKFNWEQAREMYESGVIDLQSHTYDSHYKAETIKGEKGVFSNPLTNETIKDYKNRIDIDIKKSIEGFEKNLGYRPIALAYPFGEFSEVSEEVMKENGIKVTFTVKSGYVSTNNKDTYLLNRVTISGKDSIEDFIKKLKNN